jgi:hypothetical protein
MHLAAFSTIYQSNTLVNQLDECQTMNGITFLLPAEWTSQTLKLARKRIDATTDTLFKEPVCTRRDLVANKISSRQTRDRLVQRTKYSVHIDEA